MAIIRCDEDCASLAALATHCHHFQADHRQIIIGRIIIGRGTCINA